MGTMHTYANLPDAVVQERRRQNITIAELAGKTGLPLNTVQRYVSRPYWGGRYEVYAKLAAELGLSVEARGDIPWFDADEDVPAERVKVPA